MDYHTFAVIGSFFGMLIGMWRITESFQNKINKVFKRFDDHKETVDKKLFLLQDINDAKYVRQDICSLEKSSFKEEFLRINEKLDVLLKERRQSHE